MKDQTRAYVFAGGAVLLWSTVASAFKLSLRFLDPVQLVFWASVFSTLALFCVLTVSRNLRLLKDVTKKDLVRSAVLGLLNPFGYYLVLFKAYDLLRAQEAQPLNYTWAITLSLLSIPLLKQKIRVRDLAAIVVSYAGVLVISTRGDVLGLKFSDPLGVALALGSTVLWALYWIYNTKDKTDPVLRLFLNFGFGTVYTLAAVLVLSDLRVPKWQGMMGGIYVGVFEMGVTFVLWLKALKYTENTAKVANLIFISPFLSLVFIYFLVGEKIVWATILGLLFIVAGIAVQQTGKKKDRGGGETLNGTAEEK